jgi:DNA-binding beta-propeller fold protein YncE
MRHDFSSVCKTNPHSIIARVGIALIFILLAAPLSAELMVVDQMKGIKGPARVVVSSTGDIFVTEHDMGRVVVFDSTGKKIATLVDVESPLGLAILDVPQPEPTTPEHSVAECQALVNKYEKKLTRFEDILARSQATLARLEAKKASQRKLDRVLKRVSKYEGKIETFTGLVSQYQECSVEQEPQPTLPVVYVGDEEDGSVQVINNGTTTTLGSGAGEFVQPNGIAVTADGQAVYVVDSKAHQVKVYDGQGTFLKAIGSEGEGEGQLNFPIDIAINEALGEVYITDFWNERIVVFDLAGGFVRNITAPLNSAADPSFMRPSGLGIDPVGNLYVVDNALSAVVIMDNAGTLIDIIGYANGKYWNGVLSLPTDAAADGQRIYVTSNQEGAVKVFEEVTP